MFFVGLDGFKVGAGLEVGARAGFEGGLVVVGLEVGLCFGIEAGARIGFKVSLLVVGFEVGACFGLEVGARVGFKVGSIGLELGAGVVGLEVGARFDLDVVGFELGATVSLLHWNVRPLKSSSAIMATYTLVGHDTSSTEHASLPLSLSKKVELEQS
jgi:hypothetical protein